MKLCIFSILFLLMLSTTSLALADSGTAIGRATLYLPAVESTETGYRGAMATLEVFIKEGNGHVFVDTLPLTEIDTQAGARIAKEAVEETLNTNLKNYDVFFVIRSDAPIIGGPSAGGAMATALLALTLNLSINKNVVMTGTINIDGSIGPVGGLIEKAQAVAEHNGTIFLIPEGQSVIMIEKTSKIESPIGTIITSQPQEVDLKEYAKRKWNLTVIEVGDIKKALEYMTGYRIRTEIKPMNRSDELQRVMKDLAFAFLNDAKRNLSSTKDRLQSSSISYQYEQQLKSILAEQESRLKEAEKKFNEGEYYSSSSYCFMASIQLRFVNTAISLLESREMKSYLYDRLKAAESQMKDIKLSIERKKDEINNVNDIEVILLSSDRFAEAEDYIERSWKSFYNGEYFDSAYYLSYAEERASTVNRWLRLSDAFGGDSFNFRFSDLKNVTQLRISEASSFVTYAKLIGVEVGEAEVMAENARNAYEKGDYASALFNAITARAYVDAAIETESMDINDSQQVKSALSRLEANALRDMQNAQQIGILPIMAINYYEYGKGFEESDVESATLYLIYAKHFAKVSRSIMETAAGDGIEKGSYEVHIEPAKIGMETNEIHYALIALSFFVGLSAGVIIMRLRGKKHVGKKTR